MPDDLQLLATLAARLGAGQYFSGDPETVFEELRRASAGGVADYSGISYRRIDDEQGVFWPCPATPGNSADHPGTPRLFTERFATPDGRARFLRVEHVDVHERPDADYPYVLTTGRVLAQYQSGTQTRRTRSLQLVAPTPRAELHPDLARRLGIGPDDVVELSTRRGRARFSAHVTDAIPGTTLNLKGQTNTTEKLTLDTDSARTALNLQNFVNAYNDIITTVAAQTAQGGANTDRELDHSHHDPAAGLRVLW